MANTNNPDGLDYGRTTKAVITAIRNRHRASGMSSSAPDNAASASRADFQRTRYAANEEDRIYKTYSTGMAAGQVHYEGNELRIIEGSDDEEPKSPTESVKGLSVKVVSLKPQAPRTASTKKLGNRGKILSSQVRPRSVCNSEDLAGKSNVEETIQISRMKEDRVTTRSSSQSKSKQDVEQ